MMDSDELFDEALNDCSDAIDASMLLSYMLAKELEVSMAKEKERKDRISNKIDKLRKK